MSNQSSRRAAGPAMLINIITGVFAAFVVLSTPAAFAEKLTLACTFESGDFGSQRLVGSGAHKVPGQPEVPWAVKQFGLPKGYVDAVKRRKSKMRAHQLTPEVFAAV